MDKRLETALENLGKGASEETRRALALTARILEASERMAETRAIELPSIGEEAEKRIRTGKTTVLEEMPAAISAADLADVCGRVMGLVLEETREELSEDDKQALAALPWAELISDDAAKAAGRNPEAFLELLTNAALRSGAAEGLVSRFVLPVSALALRVFIGRAARRAMTYLDRDTLEYRPYHLLPHCLVCGGDPVFARITETVANGSVRRLTCGVCGAAWNYQRIGCPYCGTTATKDLSYTHDEKDTSHRLYVCKHCGEILPTVFEAEDAVVAGPDDMERVLLADLEQAYRAANPS